MHHHGGPPHRAALFIPRPPRRLLALGVAAGLLAWTPGPSNAGTPGAPDAATPASTGGDQCGRAAAHLERPSYRFTPDPAGGWAAANEAHQLRVRVGPERIDLEPLGSGPPRWRWGLSAPRTDPTAGSDDDAAAAAEVRDERAAILRGNLVERLTNGPKGIEHALEIGATADGRPARLHFTLTGTLTPKVSDDGRSIVFRDATGAAVLIDRELRALDADGRDAAARWERLETAGGGAGLRLVIDAAEHAYPITVMGLLVTPKGSATGAAPGRGPCGESGPWSASEPSPAASPAAGPPSNDLCTGAEVIPGTGPFPWLSAAHDITDATLTGDPPLPSCQTNLSRSIWFAFTPATGGSYTLSLCADAPTGTTLDDTVLAIYAAGSPCADFTEVGGGCDDDACAAGDLQSVIDHIDLAAGTTYAIVAWQYGAVAPAPGLATVQLLVVQNPPPGPAPANDRCSGAEVIPSSGPFPYLTAVTPDVSGATTTGDPPLPSCQSNVSRSIWYSFTPAKSGRYTFSTCADAPTSTTVDDTVLAIYAGSGPCAGLAQVAGACDDDSCASEASQSIIRGVALDAGTTYAIVAWQYGLAPPAAGNTAVQLRVSEELAPPNDTCAAAATLFLDRPLAGTTANAGDDTRLPSDPGCFAGIGQIPTTAPGGDVAYSFEAPADGPYSFRVTGFEATKNAVLYAASDCPAGASPATVSGCLLAANRNSGYPGEEVSCLPMSAGQRVFLYVDEASLSPGSGFTVEASACHAETEPNGNPAGAGAPVCGIEGAIAPPGDADFFALGMPPAGSRLFAMVDGAASSSTDFDLRLTSATDTLEYDDLNNDVPFGTVAPNLAGAPATGAPIFVRVSHYSATVQAEPYRLYATVQPPPAAATPESEPNDTPAGATAGAGLYFSGTLTGTSDVDLFAFPAEAGELVVIGLDLDPGRDNTPFNGSLALLNGAGAVLLVVNDGGATSTTAPGAGSLSAATPQSPGEAVAWRVRETGIHYARVAWSEGTPGDYLLSVARDCLSGVDGDGDGVSDPLDCAPLDPGAWAVPGEATRLTVVPGPGTALLAWDPPADPGGTVVVYDVLRSDRPGDFAAPACVARDLLTTSAADPASPATAFFYLVRAGNICGSSLGTRSDGTARLAGDCP